MRYINSLGFKTGAEIGVARGDNAEMMCREIPGIKLFCIDPWGVYRENKRGGNMDKHRANHAQTIERLKPYNVTIIQATSMEAVETFNDEELDFAYIDGNHDYKYVLEDIAEWSKKVKRGGIVSGHDYYQFNNSGIIEAVAEYLKDKPEIELQLTDQNDDPDYDERHPSFWWIKP